MPTPKFHTLGAIQIPRGMIWSDEFTWSAVEKAREYSITGAQLIDAAVKQAGRPITLQAAQDAGWIARSVLVDLQALVESDPLGQYLLTLADGRTFTVQFAPVDAPVTGDPLARPELPDEDQPYIATVRLITV